MKAFHEKPDHPPSEWASPALYLLTHASLAMLPEFLKSHPGADAPGNFIRWLVARREVYAHIMDGGRLDVGDLAGLDRAESWLRERNAPR